LALNATTVWRVRAGGDNTNGGGYDAAISGAGTDYTDQDAAQLSLTDLACADSTTLTSVTGGFTSAMIGNCVRISSGTNFVAGYYFVTGRTNTNTVTLDRKPVTGGTTGSGGVGKLGGAFAHWLVLGNGAGSVTAPTITSPLAAGHLVMVRGSGSDSPVSADYTQTGYISFVAGDVASGRVRFLGYNGRPRIDGNGLIVYQSIFHTFQGFMFVATGTSNTDVGIMNGLSILIDNVIDQNGNDAYGAINAGAVIDCLFKNSGTTSAGTSGRYAIVGGSYNPLIMGNRIEDWRSGGISSAYMGVILNNVIDSCRSASTPGINVIPNDQSYNASVIGNTVHNCAGDGIWITGTNSGIATTVFNNIITNCGGYGIVGADSAALNTRRSSHSPDYNVFGTGATANTSGARSLLTAGAHDLSVDPSYADAAGGDFTPQEATLEGTSFPVLIP
jgi:hypothetical protein